MWVSARKDFMMLSTHVSRRKSSGAGLDLDESMETLACKKLLLAARLLNSALNRQLTREMKITADDYLALGTLAQQPGGILHMGELAAGTASSPGRVTHLVDRHEKRGWMKRSPCQRDERSTHVSLTKMGYELTREAAMHDFMLGEAVAGRLGAAEFDQLSDMLDRIFDRLSHSPFGQ
jgi:DNA-binding MarR family transcriptional regulator